MIYFDVPEDARQEIKFVGYEHELDRMLGWIEMHRSVFKKSYPDRQINNLYYDNYLYDSYSDNLSGVSQRRKLRYRWYGKSLFPDKGVLELKCRRNFYGWKLPYPVDQVPYSAGESWKELRSNILNQVDKNGQYLLHRNPMEVLINRYQRQYYISCNEKIRITIDKNLSVWDQRYGTMPELHRKANIPRYIIVEVKFDRKDLALASDVIQGIPIRVSRHSKYIKGLQYLL